MRSHYFIAAGIALAAVAIAATRGPQASKSSGAAPAAARVAPAQATVNSPYGLTPQDKARKNPVPFTKDSVEQGKALYQSQCAMCHGTNGDGKGDLAIALKLSLTDFTKPQTLAHYTDGELFKILSVGNATMPGQGKRMRETQLWDLVNFLRAVGGAVPSSPSGKRK